MSRAIFPSTAVLSGRSWDGEPLMPAATARHTHQEAVDPPDVRGVLHDLAFAGIVAVLWTVGVTGLVWLTLGSVALGPILI